jgi:ribosomal subunit interface protein
MPAPAPGDRIETLAVTVEIGARMSQINVEITGRGTVSEHARSHARDKIQALERYVNAPILGARVVLITERNPRIAAHARAEAEIDLQGHLIRACADAETVEAATDAATERLQRQLRRFVDRLVTKHHATDRRRPRELPT